MRNFSQKLGNLEFWIPNYEIKNPADGSLTAAEDLQSCMEQGVLSIKNTYSGSGDVQDGQETQGSLDSQGTHSVQASPDRVLILAGDTAEIAVPERQYGEQDSEDTMRKVFEW